MAVLNNVVNPFLINAFVAKNIVLNVCNHILLVLSSIYIKLRVTVF